MGLAKCDRRVASPTGTGRARQWLRSAPDNDTATITAVSHDFMCSQDLYDAVWAETRTGRRVRCGAVRYRKRGLPRFIRFSVIPGARPISPITESRMAMPAGVVLVRRRGTRAPAVRSSVGGPRPSSARERRRHVDDIRPPKPIYAETDKCWSPRTRARSADGPDGSDEALEL